MPTLDTLWCTVFTKLPYALNLGLVQLLSVTGRLLTTTHAKSAGFELYQLQIQKYEQMVYF